MCIFLSFILLYIFLKAVEATHKTEEIVISSHKSTNEEEARRIATVKAFELVEKKS